MTDSSPPFAALPKWAFDAIKGVESMCVPDILYLGNRFDFYYAASTGGGRHLVTVMRVRRLWISAKSRSPSIYGNVPYLLIILVSRKFILACPSPLRITRKPCRTIRLSIIWVRPSLRRRSIQVANKTLIPLPHRSKSMANGFFGGLRTSSKRSAFGPLYDEEQYLKQHQVLSRATTA